MSETLLVEISIIIAVGLLMSGVMTLLRQPLIIGYIFTGIIVGPNVLNLIKSADMVATFAQLGVVVLLFMVGLNLSPKIFREVGKVSIVTGLGQIVFTSIIGFFISYLLGFSALVSIYVSVALTFSSTIIILKILSDKDDLDTLYGKISIGFLLVQDVVAMVALVALSSFSKLDTINGVSNLSILAGVFFLIFIGGFAYKLLPHLMRHVAKSQEYLMLFSLGWCLFLAVVFFKLGLSMEIGALLAGIFLSISPYRYEIYSKIRPLRDFFIFLFFILLGSQMVFSNLGEYLIPIIVFSVFILIGNPLIVVFLMGRLGYTKKTGFLAGLTVAQISEFSLILIALGVKLGHLSDEILSMVTVVGLITIAGSTYAMIYVDKYYHLISKFLTIFEKDQNKLISGTANTDKDNEIVIFGYDRMGYSILSALHKLEKTFLVVDFTPEKIGRLTEKNINCVYGDASDSDFIDSLHLSRSKMIISTIPDYEINSLILDKVREHSEKTITIFVSNKIDESLRLYNDGATYVIIPRFLGGEHASSLIEKYGFDLNLYQKERVNHLEHLSVRKTLGHNHHEYKKKSNS